MSMIDVFSVIAVLTALFAYINFRFIKLPTSSGVMVIAMICSLVLIALQQFAFDLTYLANSVLSKIDFHETLMNGMLSVLLFAGAMHIELKNLTKQKGFVFILSTVGLLLSTCLVAGLAYCSFGLVGININFFYCLVFGALISPTDPISVLALLKQGGAPLSVQSKISGESLFNDGFGVVIFLILLRFATGEEPTFLDAGKLLIIEGVGGLALGGVLGYTAYLMMKSIDNYSVEVLITIAVVFGGYSLAKYLHTSGPLAMVVAGLLIGNQGRALAMSDTTRIYLDHFWELLDEVLNACLFVIIGLEIILIPFSRQVLMASVLVIPAVLLSRLISVALTVKTMEKFRKFSPNIIKLMTWGGLRGGISIALALSLPHSPYRNTIISVTYFVVIFSVGVQATTFPILLKKFSPRKKV